MASLTCSPSVLTASTPCTACMSQTEMVAALGYIMAKINGVADTSVKGLIVSAKCFDCLNDHQKLEATVNLFYNLAKDLGVMPAAANLKGLTATLAKQKPGTIKSILLDQLCKTQSVY